MRLSLEERLAAMPMPVQEQFHADCADIFSANAGERVLSVLLQLSGPYSSAFRSELAEMAAAVAEKEFIHLLWRRVGNNNQMPQLPKQKDL